MQNIKVEYNPVLEKDRMPNLKCQECNGFYGRPIEFVITVKNSKDPLLLCRECYTIISEAMAELSGDYGDYDQTILDDDEDYTEEDYADEEEE